jgi:acyl-CoA synthetase (AMP-forming)/AMP-acid ligase II
MPFLTEKLVPERYRSDLTALLRITRPAAVVTYADFEAEVLAALPEESSVRMVLTAEGCPDPLDPDFDGLRGMQCQREDIVLLQHSSGTTGLQKGVALAHAAVLNQLESYGAALRINPNDVIVSWLPLYHDMGLIAGFLLPILKGIPLVIMSPFDWVRAPQRLMQAVSSYRGSLVWLPNFAYNFCAAKIRARHLEGVDLSSLRAVINCSEPMRDESHQRFLERFEAYGLNPSAIATSYAMAENVFAVTQGGIDAPVTVDVIDRDIFQNERRAVPAQMDVPVLRMVSAGKTIESTEIKAIDEAGHELPERWVGELAVRSNCMLTGYYNRPEETTRVMLNGWYRTGDYGYIADGEVYISGRKKDLMIIGGKNIYPQDLEVLAMEVEGVHPGRVVAFGVFDPEAGTEEAVVVAETDADEAAELERIETEIRMKVTRGSAVSLRTVHLVRSMWLIKTSSGKIARAANREKFLAETQD